MTDMLVKLYDLPEISSKENPLLQAGYRIFRPLRCELPKVAEFVKSEFDNESWGQELQGAFEQLPPKLWIAVKDNQVVGFACYDITAKGMFGPIGVHQAHQGKGIAQVLMVKSLMSLRELGHAYGIIGWVSSEAFYEKAVNAIAIPDSTPGIYANRVDSGA